MCNCGEIDGGYYNILGLKRIDHFGTFNGYTSVIPKGETVDFENYRGLNFIFNSEFTFGEVSKKYAPFNFSLMNTAYGCDCAFNGSDGSLQQIVGFDIITMNDFDSLHLANDTINEYFTIDLYNTSLDSFLANNKEKKIYPVNLNGNNPNELEFQLLLNQQSSLDSTFQVKVTIELDNGAVYSMESDAITFIR
jgi:hypothetical protein